jgi:superfamily II DNA or RNA helicase
VLTRWLRSVGDDAIREAVGPTAFLRGAAYARQGRVLQLRTQDDGTTLLAKVRGSGPTPYSVVISAGDDGLGLIWWTGDCSCPIGGDCKHVAAVLQAARAASPAPPAPPPSTWERTLAGLLPVPEAAKADESIPLALQFELLPAVRSPMPRAVRAERPADRSQVRIRPVVPGRTGWVRSGISWRDLSYSGAHLRHNSLHRRVLAQLHAAHRTNPQAYYYSDTPVLLSDFGPDLWPLLEQLLDAGVELVPAKGTPGPVTLAAAPAELSLDMRRDGPAGAASLHPVVSLGGTPLPAAGFCLLGDPVHGLVLDQAPGTAGLMLAPMAGRVAPAVSRLVDSSEPVRIPAGDVDRFLRQYYPALSRVVAVRSSDDTVALPEVGAPRLALTVTYAADHLATLDWGFAYQVGNDLRRFPLSGDDGAATRDPRAERQLVASVPLPVDRLPRLREQTPDQLPATGLELRGIDTVLLTEQVLPALREADVLVDVVGAPPEYRHTTAVPLVQVSATDAEDADWFDLGVTVSVEGEQIPFQQLFIALASGDSHLVLDSGTYFRLDRPEFEQLRRLIEEARALQDRDGDSLRISRYQVGLWDELTELGVIAEQSDRWKQSVQGLLDIGTVTPPPPPPGLTAELRPYQLEGYQWLTFLAEHGLGGVLADDMGLGKTLQTLAMVAAAKDSGRLPHPMLVVAPTSVVPNWAAEAARFVPGLTVATVTETETRRAMPLPELVAGADLVITSYALFRIDAEAYRALSWSGLVLDEAQFVKNHQAKTYQCARQLVTPFKLAITGTPLENSLMDLWSLLSIVAPGLFPSPQRFAEFYRTPIERGTDPELLATLRRRIRPLLRRRTKEQVAAELPPKQEQVLDVTLNPKHQKIYQTHLQRERTKVLGLVDDLNKNRFTIFRSLTLLRQLSLDPALVDEKYRGVPASKVEVLTEHLREVVDEGHRVLVFSQFTGFLRTVRDRLAADGIAYAYLDGRTRDRAKRIEEFRSGTAPVFLISLKAGGFGLNLTEADYVFVLDPWWNPAAEAQAVDRTHRIGQDKKVMVYRLVATGTIEEKVMALKARKADLFARVMDDDALMAAPLTAEDIKELFAS